ncbi:MAG: WbqC family protein [Candidatus Binatia bacterium]
MRVVVLQPSYLPWLGYFDQMFKSDVFVVYDDVQYDKNGWRNRNRIKTPQGPQWLTVPVLTKGRKFPLNREVEINNTISWQTKQLKSIVQNYRKAPLFQQYVDPLQAILGRNWRFLIDLNMACMQMVVNQLGLNSRIVFSSELKISRTGKSERLVDICRHFGADTFLEGDMGKNYIDEELFVREGIHVEYHAYRHPIYHQLHGDFLPYMSVIDLLLNHGRDSLGILTHQKAVS